MDGAACGSVLSEACADVVDRLIRPATTAVLTRSAGRSTPNRFTERTPLGCKHFFFSSSNIPCKGRATGLRPPKGDSHD
jgi:hypothetical protein